MQFLDGETVGIDLGTTYSAIAHLNDEGEPTILNNADDRPITPSVVLLGDSGRVMVGPSFERIALEKPENVVEAVKRQMGSKDYYVVYQGKKLTPEFISALILKKLKQDAEVRIGAVANAVVTVPYYFNDVRRKATQDAGKVAGLNVVDIINEPTAATLAYAWSKGNLGRVDDAGKETTILVYDLGGGTFDVTVVRFTSTTFRVLATDGDVMLGGLDWSNRLVDHLAEQFTRKHGDDPRQDPEGLRAFFQECEDAKRKLSQGDRAAVSVYFKGKTLTVQLTRADFERMTADLMQRTRDTTELVLQQSGVDPADLDEVVLIGGATYMPIVEKTLRDITKQEPSRSLMPERAVAEGAAIHAAILQAKHGGGGKMADALRKRLERVEQVDVNSHSLGIKVADPEKKGSRMNHVMIPRNTSIPASKTQRFKTTSDNQKTVHVEVLEGEAKDPAACTLIGDFRIVGLPPDMKKGSPVEVTYSYDASGRISARARDLTNDKEAATEIVRDGGLSENRVTDFEKLAQEYDVD
jgi:molecular chaperone DnaK